MKNEIRKKYYLLSGHIDFQLDSPIML